MNLNETQLKKTLKKLITDYSDIENENGEKLGDTPTFAELRIILRDLKEGKDPRSDKQIEKAERLAKTLHQFADTVEGCVIKDSMIEVDNDVGTRQAQGAIGWLEHYLTGEMYIDMRFYLYNPKLDQTGRI